MSGIRGKDMWETGLRAGILALSFALVGGGAAKSLPAAPGAVRGSAPPARTRAQEPERGWVIWETAAPVQRLALEGETVWAGMYRGGLGRFSLDEGPLAYYSSADGLPGEDILSIAPDGTGGLWVAALDGGIAHSSAGEAFAELTPPPPADRAPWALVARAGEVWLGTLGGGVASRSGGTWRSYTTANSNLPADDIYAVAVDRDGTPWIGTLGYGVAALQDGDWARYGPPLEIPNPLSPDAPAPNRAITDIAVDPAGNKWFATDGSGVAVLDAQGTGWSIYNRANSGLGGDFVQSTFIDSSGNYWFGTLGGGVSRLSADRSNWLTYDTSNSAMIEDDVLDAVVDAGGGLWLAAYDAGLAYFGPLPSPLPGFDLDPFGEPEMRPGEAKGYYLWLDRETYRWTLAWSGDGDAHTFSGELSADGEIRVVEALGLEDGDEVRASGNALSVSAHEADGGDGVVFELDHEATRLTLRLQIDGAYYPFSIHVGGRGEEPGTAPFSLAAPGPEPPVVEAGDEVTVKEGDLVLFNGSFSDPDSPTGHDISWDLGDGTAVSDSLSPSHHYVDDGAYTATLTVTDEHGMVGSDSRVITVTNAPPEVDFFADPYSPYMFQSVRFEAFLFDPGELDTHTLTWDFGDGSEPLTTQELNVEHTYQAAGEYVASLKAVDDDGGETEVSLAIAVQEGFICDPAIEVQRVWMGQVDLRGREYYTARRGLHGEEEASPVTIGDPTYAGSANDWDHPWEFLQGGEMVDRGGMYLRSSPGNRWTLPLSGDRSACWGVTAYLWVNHNRSARVSTYELSAGEAAVSLRNDENFRTLYAVHVVFNGDIKVAMEAISSNDDTASFLLAGAVVDSESIPTPTPTATATITPTATPAPEYPTWWLHNEGTSQGYVMHPWPAEGYQAAADGVARFYADPVEVDTSHAASRAQLYLYAQRRFPTSEERITVDLFRGLRDGGYERLGGGALELPNGCCSEPELREVAFDVPAFELLAGERLILTVGPGWGATELCGSYGACMVLWDGEYAESRLELAPRPTPTPTSTPTSTHIPTSTTTSSPSPSATQTPTPTPSASATPTPTPTGTSQPTPSSTPTASPTTELTPSETATPDQTETPTVSSLSSSGSESGVLPGRSAAWWADASRRLWNLLG